MAEKVEFRKNRDFGELVSDTFLFVKQNFKPLLKVFTAFCGAFVLFGIIIAVIQIITPMNTVRNPTDIINVMDVKNVKGSYLFVSLAIGVFGYVAIYTSILSFIALYIKNNNEAPTLEEVWPEFKRLYFSILASSVVLAILLILSLVLCIVPALYVFPAISLFLPIMVFEEANFGYSFDKMLKLLKNKWWQTASSLFVIWFVIYVSSMLVIGPTMVLNYFTMFTGETGILATFSTILITIFQYLLQMIMIVPVIGASLCYFSLDEYHNNTGLMERIDTLGQKQDAFEHPEEY